MEKAAAQAVEDREKALEDARKVNNSATSATCRHTPRIGFCFSIFPFLKLIFRLCGGSGTFMATSRCHAVANIYHSCHESSTKDFSPYAAEVFAVLYQSSRHPLYTRPSSTTPLRLLRLPHPNLPLRDYPLDTFSSPRRLAARKSEPSWKTRTHLPLRQRPWRTGFGSKQAPHYSKCVGARCYCRTRLGTTPKCCARGRTPAYIWMAKSRIGTFLYSSSRGASVLHIVFCSIFWRITNTAKATGQKGVFDATSITYPQFKRRLRRFTSPQPSLEYSSPDINDIQRNKNRFKQTYFARICWQMSAHAANKKGFLQG